jgi:hypothetical protein
MSRSEYCYVVLGEGEIKAAFTVKYKLVEWLTGGPHGLGFDQYDIYRCQAGRGSEHKVVFIGHPAGVIENSE